RSGPIGGKQRAGFDLNVAARAELDVTAEPSRFGADIDDAPHANIHGANDQDAPASRDERAAFIQAAGIDRRLEQHALIQVNAALLRRLAVDLYRPPV